MHKLILTEPSGTAFRLAGMPDWSEIVLDVVRVRTEQGDPAAADYLRTRIEAAFVPRAEYDKLGMGTVASLADMGTQLGQATARAEAAEAENARLREALECLAQPRVMEWEECRDIARQALGGEHEHG